MLIVRLALTLAQQVPVVTAVRVHAAPTLDGRLSEPLWTRAPAVTALVQTDPDEGRAVSESTEVRIVYDDAALYVGARLFDRDPGGIAQHFTRRDVITASDEFHLLLDTYHDRRTTFLFAVSPSGGRRDAVAGDDGSDFDDSWDPVWQVATRVDSLGWTVEMRIPFSQLRFSGAPDQVWGIRLDRWIQRKNELAMFPFVAKTESGTASRFADLVGLHFDADRRRLEVLPYALTRSRFDRPAKAGNPFDDGHTTAGSAGLDLKAGMASNLTLDLTVNPDFGQVELDPAYVNLTAFEQKLSEHRPFFVEGAEIFKFGGTGGGINPHFATPQLFYSRRIGRPPQGKPTSPGQFTDMPENSTILGAAKLSGKTADGWSVGALEALTAREYAIVADTVTGSRRHDEVEPFTSHFAGRVKRDFGGGATTLGFMTTMVQRDLNRPSLAFLNASAYTAGADFTHRWHDHAYTLAGSLIESSIHGDPAALQIAQRASDRYYQRPDAVSFHFDPERTSLSGVAADLYLNKVSGNWLWGVAASTMSPGFEINDLGFQERVDIMTTSLAGARRWTRPGRVFREAYVSLTARNAWNYDGNLIERRIAAYAQGEFRNFWQADLTVSRSGWVLDDRLTRGGPLSWQPDKWSTTAEAYSDNRKALSVYGYLTYTQDAAGGWYFNALPSFTYRPAKSLSASLGIGYEAGREAAHYVQRVTDSIAAGTYGARYVFAALHERSAYLTLRVNAAFTRTLSLQLYAQPFTFVGDYSGFKELAAPRTYTFVHYGQDRGSTITPTGHDYTVDPDGPGPAEPFYLANPNFRSRSFRMNAVWRWEYRPGSTLYLVWSQTRYRELSDVAVGLAPDLRHATFLDRPTNVVMLKVDYWLRN